MGVKIYTTPTCGYCHQAKAFFTQTGVPFEEVDVSADRAAAQEMVDLTGQMGVPVIVIGDEVIIGFDRARIQQLIASGAAAKGGTATGAARMRFGLKIADAQKMAASSGGVAVSGAVIGEVEPGQYGDKAGLKSGDIITQISGREIGNASDMARVISTIKPGDIVTIMFRRSGETRKSEIVV
jgi:glutaredoxin 3